MTSTMIALLLTVWALTVQGSAGGMSTAMANYLTVFNGYYDNAAQVKADNNTHDYIQLWLIPVTTSAFHGRTVLFFEWDYNGVVYNIELADPSEGPLGTIHLAVYNFTDTSQYKRGADLKEYLSKLTPSDINKRPPYCDAFFRPSGPGNFLGSWPSCKHYINGKPTIYAGIAMCNIQEVIPPRTDPRKPSDAPINFVLKGDRYKVPGIPDGFVSPCS